MRPGVGRPVSGGSNSRQNSASSRSTKSIWRPTSKSNAGMGLGCSKKPGVERGDVRDRRVVAGEDEIEADAGQHAAGHQISAA